MNIDTECQINFAKSWECFRGAYEAGEGHVSEVFCEQLYRHAFMSGILYGYKTHRDITRPLTDLIKEFTHAEAKT